MRIIWLDELFGAWLNDEPVRDYERVIREASSTYEDEVRDAIRLEAEYLLNDVTAFKTWRSEVSPRWSDEVVRGWLRTIVVAFRVG